MDRINMSMSAKPTPSPQVGQTQIQDTLKAKGGKASMGGSLPQASALLQDSARQQAQGQMQQSNMLGEISRQGLQAQDQQQQSQFAAAQQGLAVDKEMARSGMQANEQRAAAIRDATEQDFRAKRSADENMRLDALQSTATMNLRDLTTQRKISLDNIFAEQKRSTQELEFRQDGAELEELAFNLALSDRAYMDELDRIGKERMLYSDLNFQEETARITLGEGLDNLRDDMDWGRSFNADRRQWEQEIATISLESAMEIARAEISGNNQRAAWEGIGQMASTGAKYATGGYDTPKTTTNNQESFDTIPAEGPVRR